MKNKKINSENRVQVTMISYSIGGELFNPSRKLSVYQQIIK